MQISRFSPWGTEVKPFQSLQKNMKDYIKECQTIANSFTNRSYPFRSKLSPLPKDLEPHRPKEAIWFPDTI